MPQNVAKNETHDLDIELKEVTCAGASARVLSIHSQRVIRATVVLGSQSQPVAAVSRRLGA